MSIQFILDYLISYIVTLINVENYIRIKLIDLQQRMLWIPALKMIFF